MTKPRAHHLSGMSTFSTPGGLYERAQKQFGLQDGKKLFCYSFFDRQRLDVQPFFADIYDEALSARAAPGHRAIAAIHRAGKLLRHYTLNIDGLAADVGMDTWHPDNNPDGVTVEMHGSIQQLVCPACDVVCGITDEHLILLRAKQALPCGACGQGVLRWRVMMYDDAESMLGWWVGESVCLSMHMCIRLLHEQIISYTKHAEYYKTPSAFKTHPPHTTSSTPPPQTQVKA